MYSLRVIQYNSFLSTWYQSTGSKSPLYFILFQPFPRTFSGAAIAFAIPHRSVFLGSPSPSPCFELVHIPIETLGVNCARAVENSQIEVSTLPHTPTEDSAATSGFCRSAADTAVQSLSLPPRSIAQSPSCSEPPRTSPSDGGRAGQRFGPLVHVPTRRHPSRVHRTCQTSVVPRQP